MASASAQLQKLDNNVVLRAGIHGTIGGLGRVITVLWTRITM